MGFLTPKYSCAHMPLAGLLSSHAADRYAIGCVVARLTLLLAHPQRATRPSTWAPKTFCGQNGVSVGSQSVHNSHKAVNEPRVDILQHGYKYAPLNITCWPDWLPSETLFFTTRCRTSPAQHDPRGHEHRAGSAGRKVER